MKKSYITPITEIADIIVSSMILEGSITIHDNKEGENEEDLSKDRNDFWGETDNSLW